MDCAKDRITLVVVREVEVRRIQMAKLSLDETRELKVLVSQIKALCDTIQEILNDSNTMEISRYTSFHIMAQTYNDFVERTRSLLRVPTMLYTFKTENMPGAGDTLWSEQKNILEQTLLYSKMLLSSLEGSIDFADDEFDNLNDFILLRLRSAVFSLPEKEVDIQNAIESLLLGKSLSKGLDYDRESGKFEFSGKEYIPDFIIPKLSLCIEVKLLRPGKKSQIIEEISADITAYRKQYTRLLFVVYDLGVIQNEEEFKRDIEMTDGVKVIIVKH